MSEFTCKNGHQLRAGQYKCPICGGKLSYMDGYSNRELVAMERWEEKNEREGLKEK